MNQYSWESVKLKQILKLKINLIISLETKSFSQINDDFTTEFHRLINTYFWKSAKICAWLSKILDCTQQQFGSQVWATMIMIAGKYIQILNTPKLSDIDIFRRINAFTILINFVMQVRSCAKSRFSKITYDISFLDFLPCFNIIFEQLCIKGSIYITVLDENQISISLRKFSLFNNSIKSLSIEWNCFTWTSSWWRISFILQHVELSLWMNI